MTNRTPKYSSPAARRATFAAIFAVAAGAFWVSLTHDAQLHAQQFHNGPTVEPQIRLRNPFTDAPTANSQPAPAPQQTYTLPSAARPTQSQANTFCPADADLLRRLQGVRLPANSGKVVLIGRPRQQAGDLPLPTDNVPQPASGNRATELQLLPEDDSAPFLIPDLEGPEEAGTLDDEIPLPDLPPLELKPEDTNTAPSEPAPTQQPKTNGPKEAPAADLDLELASPKQQPVAQDPAGEQTAREASPQPTPLTVPQASPSPGQYPAQAQPIIPSPQNPPATSPEFVSPNELTSPRSYPEIPPLPNMSGHMGQSVSPGPANGAVASPALNGQPAVISPGPTVTGAEDMLYGHSMLCPGTSGSRATLESDAYPHLAPFTARSRAAREAAPQNFQRLPSLPSTVQPWWEAGIPQQVDLNATTQQVDIRTLMEKAMRHSPQVIALRAEPEIRRFIVVQEEARFDWSTFLNAEWNDLNDPVGNTLVTGNGSDRLETERYEAEGGFRRRRLDGSEFTVQQRIGTETQNSRFFVPRNQGTSTFEVTYRQPLLDGAGQTYNESEIILARIKANSSEDEVVGELQSHLVQVATAYWTLFRARAEFLQRQKLLQSAQDVLTVLEGRARLDTIPRQILRARAAVARAQTRIQRTLARIKDAEAQLRLLVNAPEMLNGGPTELLPIEPPSLVTESADIQSILQTALVNRTDISKAIRRMRTAGVELGVSQKELLPRLDFLVEAYVADLAGQADIARSIRGQFTESKPGYTVGFEFEVPISNRAAQARLAQRQWELTRSINVFRATVEKSLTDVEIAKREVSTSFSEIQSRYYSMKATRNEANYLRDRFEVLPGAQDSATLLLEDLLDSQERLSDEEAAFVEAQANHAIALIKLKEEMGILLRSPHARPELDSSNQAWMAERFGIQQSETPNQSGPAQATAPVEQPPVQTQTISHDNPLAAGFTLPSLTSQNAPGTTPTAGPVTNVRATMPNRYGNPRINVSRSRQQAPPPTQSTGLGSPYSISR